MKNRKKKNKYVLLLILLLVVSIGYALISTQLKITGNATVSKQTWDVHFANVHVNSESATATVVPTTDNTTTTVIPYTVSFTKPGDFYEFTVDIVNGGTINAMFDLLTNDAYSSDGTTKIDMPVYLSSTLTYYDDTQINRYDGIKAGKYRTVKVRVQYRTDIEKEDLPSDSDQTITLKLSATYKQADSNAVYPSAQIISSCPGCVYTYTTATLNYGPDGTVLNPDQYTEDYEDISNKRVFLGMILNNNRIDRGFVCSIKNNIPFCIEASLSDDDGGDPDTRAANYEKNTNLLQGEGLWGDDCYMFGEQDSTIRCYNGDVVAVDTDVYGNASTIYEDEICFATEYTELHCYKK